jgi:hypothetical protein
MTIEEEPLKALHSQNFRFQITIYTLSEIGIFFSINTYICALNQGTHTSSKIILWKQFGMNLVLEYN